MNGRAPMVFHGKRPNSMVPQKQRGGHAYQAATDNQDRNFKVGQKNVLANISYY